ncbi:MAG: hypothetical protein ACPGRX_06930 [Bdellovibrionales bacterium]
MPEQYVNRKKLCEIFKKVAFEAYRIQRGRNIETGAHDFETRSYLTPSPKSLQINGNPKKQEIWMSPHPDLGCMNIDFVAEQVNMKIDRDESDKLTNFDIHGCGTHGWDNELDLSQEEFKDHTPKPAYYDLTRDGELTVEKAAELIDIFAIAITQISPMGMDRTYGLMEGPGKTNEEMQRMSFEERAMAIAETLTL